MLDETPWVKENPIYGIYFYPCKDKVLTLKEKIIPTWSTYSQKQAALVKNRTWGFRICLCGCWVVLIYLIAIVTTLSFGTTNPCC